MSDERRAMSDECMRLRDSLLTAEPDELRGHGQSDLATHIRDCARCSADAQRILGATALLAGQLDRTARIAPVRTVSKPSESLPAWWALPIAAVLASVLIANELRRAPDPEAPRVGLLQDVRRPVDVPVVNAPADRNVAVFRTTENITVVWNLGAKGGS
ncbi:MAG: hypothetical protein WEE89_20115 [Gemmatimonadota bacterium]